MRNNYFHLTFKSASLIVLAISFLTLGLIFTKDAFAEDPSATNDQRLVTIHDQGSSVTLVTRSSTVAEAISQANIAVSKHDMVEPAVTEKIAAKSYHINIFRARPVIVVDGDKQVKVMTAEQSPRQIAEAAGFTFYNEDIAEFGQIDSVLASDGIGIRMVIKRATVFSFTLYGKHSDARTQSKTVGEMLEEKGIYLGADDKVSPSKDQAIAGGIEVRVWREGVQTMTVEEVVAKPVEEVKDRDQERGWREVKTKGQDGKRQVTYEIVIQDGVEVSRKEIASITTLEPVKEVVAVGAKIMGSYTTPSENESITWSFLMGKGLTREQTAGIMGNLMQEHHFKTSGDGLAQWTGGRKARLMALDDPYNIHTQLNFMWTELTGPYSSTLNNIRASTTVEASVRYFQNGYERCGLCMEDRRIQYAYNILASH